MAVDIRADADLGMIAQNDSILGLGSEKANTKFLHVGLTSQVRIFPKLFKSLGVNYLTNLGAEPARDSIVTLNAGVRYQAPSFDVGLAVPLVVTAPSTVADAYDFGLLVDISHAF